MSNAPAVLFGDVTFEEPTKASLTRTKVDVPVEILEVLKKAQALNKRPVWPVRDEVHAAAMSDVLYSANDHLEGASVLPALGYYKDGVFTRLKDWSGDVKPTHVKVTVGKPRGRKAHPDAKAETNGQSPV